MNESREERTLAELFEELMDWTTGIPLGLLKEIQAKEDRLLALERGLEAVYSDGPYAERAVGLFD